MKAKLFIIIFFYSIVWGQSAFYDFNQLQQIKEIYIFVGNNMPFTGEAVKKNSQGKILEKIGFKDGYFNGQWLVYNDNGNQIGGGSFIHGTGTYKLYYDLNENKVLEDTSYKNNLLNGKSIRYFENGKKASEHDYILGEISGKQYIWDECGKLYLERDWKNDRIHGLWREWYSTGEMEALGNFDDGEGTLIRFYKNGSKKSMAKYKKNILDGKRIGWRENGTKAYVDWFKNGKQCGKSFEWDENGKQIKKH